MRETDAELRPVMAGSTLLIVYLSLADDLVDDEIVFPADPPAGAREVRRRSLEQQLRALQAMQIAGHAEDAAEVLTWMAPRHVPHAVAHLIDTIRGWLAQSGLRPDHEAWCAGATSYLVPMVPAVHRSEATRLLDPTVNVTAGPRPLDAWHEHSRTAHPVAAPHAAAALATWLYIGPGAVHNPKQVAVDLAQRNLDLGQRIGYVPPP